MKIIRQIIVATCLLAGGILAQENTPSRFEDFPVTQRYSGRPVSVNLSSHPQARVFRTKLRENARDGVNFAGHYVLATWGCGSACTQLAIIDARTGKVYFPPELSKIIQFDLHKLRGERPLQFRIDSRLLIAVGNKNEEFDTPPGIFPTEKRYYYVWQNNRLKLIEASAIK